VGSAVRRDHRPELEGLEVRIAPATDVWTGAVSGSWTTAGNWTGGVAPVAGDDLDFPAGAANLLNTNDFPSGTRFNSITIAGAGYTLSGNAMNLTTGITASYTTGTSTDSINTTLTAIVAPISVASGGILDISGVLSGSAGLNVTGAGTLDLLGVNTYTGATSVGSGTRLVVDGTIAGVQVNGGLLAGNGTVGAVSSVGGVVLPGHPATTTSPLAAPGQLTDLGGITLDSGSTFGAVLNGTAPGNGVTGYSQLIVSSGLVGLGGATLNVALGANYIPTVGDQLTIILNNTGKAVTGAFTGLPEGGAVTAGNSLFRISYVGPTGTGQDVVLSAVSAPSTTTLLPISFPSTPGQPITLSAQVTGSQGIPTGTVEFFNGNPSAGGVVLASAPVNAGTGIATATVSSIGNISSTTAIYAVYIPTPTVFTYAGSTSSPITFGTTTTLSTSSSVSPVGQPVTFTATVTPTSPGAGTPTGTVEFFADNTLVGAVPLNAATGKASFTTSSLGVGAHTIIAEFFANSPFQNSTSGPLTQNIGTIGTLPVLTLQPVFNRHGKLVKVELVARVQPTPPATGTPLGSVTYFINGRASYQSVPLTGGVAVLSVLPQRLVNQYVFVRYNGNPSFVASASANIYISHRTLVSLSAAKARVEQDRRGR
jgi:hypothetical protein